jgi:hypothetical protein
VELALAELASQAIFSETGQNLLDMFYMLLESIREDEDIIKVDDTEDIEEVAKTIVGIRLKRGRSVGKTERHDEIFEVTIASTEGGFVFLTRRNAELVVGISHIKASEELCTFEAIEQF